MTNRYSLYLRIAFIAALTTAVVLVPLYEYRGSGRRG